MDDSTRLRIIERLDSRPNAKGVIALAFIAEFDSLPRRRRPIIPCERAIAESAVLQLGLTIEEVTVFFDEMPVYEEDSWLRYLDKYLSGHPHPPSAA